MKKTWKALPVEVNEKIEDVYNPAEKTKKRVALPDTDYEVSLNIYTYVRTYCTYGMKYWWRI